MTYTNLIEIMQNALTGVTKNVFHYTRPQNISAPFIVWQEEGDGSILSADNKNEYRTLRGAIHFYTKKECDNLIDEIEKSLNENSHISWSLESVQYEDQTKLIHFEWLFEVG